MADIIQAAKWMHEGQRVRRPFLNQSFSIGASESPFWPHWLLMYENGHLTKDNRTAPFTTEDLLADDWEIAE